MCSNKNSLRMEFHVQIMICSWYAASFPVVNKLVASFLFESWHFLAILYLAPHVLCNWPSDLLGFGNDLEELTVK